MYHDHMLMHNKKPICRTYNFALVSMKGRAKHQSGPNFTRKKSNTIYSLRFVINADQLSATFCSLFFFSLHYSFYLNVRIMMNEMKPKKIFFHNGLSYVKDTRF